jgi:predicted ester cyclase
VSEQETVVRRLFAEGFTGGKPTVIDEVFAADATYEQPGVPRGMQGLHLIVQQFDEAFADWRFDVEDCIAAGDGVAVRWTARGIHESTFVGEGPTGRDVEMTGISVYRFDGDRIVGAWSSPDTLGPLQQLGAMPTLSIVD